MRFSLDHLNEKQKGDLIDHLFAFVTDAKKQRIEDILAKRTRHIAVVLEDVFKSHNGSAVIRSAECFGIQDLYTIENVNAYSINSYVTRGASNWVNLHRFNSKGQNNTKQCLSNLKSKGFKIIATSPHPHAIELDQVVFDKKVAIAFGTEEIGLSHDAFEMADELVKIPMKGFTESFNISVTAAICLYELRKQLEKSGVEWSLNEEEKQDLRLQWGRDIIKNSDILVKEFLKSL
jgi:tRNA (guanosine-2'-O-)-methyltransferase